MEINMLELTKELIKYATIGADDTDATATGYSAIKSKEAIAEGDYLENIAFVGETVDHKNVIVVLDNALCTSGLSLEGKNKGEVVSKFTFECHADADESLTTLPWHIYYPTRTQ